MKKNLFVRILAIVLALAMIAGSAFYLIYMIGSSSNAVYAMDSEDEAKIDNIKALITVIENEYKDKVDTKKLINAAYDGIFDMLDPWSVYYASSEEKDSFVNSLSNEELCGIGVTITFNSKDQCYIKKLIPNAPAMKAGLLENDIITAVAGKSVAGLSLDEISKRIQGKEGTTVKVTVIRAGKTLNYNIKREKFNATSVYSKVFNPVTGKEISNTNELAELKGLIGYIEIEEFSETLLRDLYKAKLTLSSYGIDKIIIDLRDNPGGYMGAAMDGVSLFLKSGMPLAKYWKDGKLLDTEGKTTEDNGGSKLVLLINGDSASASEAFAAVLRDNKAATIVGTNSFGKGVAQEIFELGDGSYFKLSTCYFTGPNGNKIDGVGIKPDYLVYNTVALSEEELANLEKNTIPMNEGKKYLTLNSYGLNVFAAQQRLKALGYEVELNSKLDLATMTALKDVQKQAGVYVYGGLDFATTKILEERYQTLFNESGDEQLNKAIELLK